MKLQPRLRHFRLLLQMSLTASLFSSFVVWLQYEKSAASTLSGFWVKRGLTFRLTLELPSYYNLFLIVHQWQFFAILFCRQKFITTSSSDRSDTVACIIPSEMFSSSILILFQHLKTTCFSLLEVKFVFRTKITFVLITESGTVQNTKQASFLCTPSFLDIVI